MIHLPVKEANDETILNMVSHEKLGAGGSLRSKFCARNLFGAKLSNAPLWIGEISWAITNITSQSFWTAWLYQWVAEQLCLFQTWSVDYSSAYNAYNPISLTLNIGAQQKTCPSNIGSEAEMQQEGMLESQGLGESLYWRLTLGAIHQLEQAATRACWPEFGAEGLEGGGRN